MSSLADLARLIRSRNAGPFWLTFAIMYDGAATDARVKKSGVTDRDFLARLFDRDLEIIRLFCRDNALAIKVSIPRPITQGDCGNTDGHGGQEYAPLMAIESP